MGIVQTTVLPREGQSNDFNSAKVLSVLTADDMYAYNLMWIGAHGWFNTIYSVNMIEYQPDKFINYIALGHRLEFGKTALELDFMNRAADHQTYFF